VDINPNLKRKRKEPGDDRFSNHHIANLELTFRSFRWLSWNDFSPNYIGCPLFYS
jgi:hypothetical protein